MSRNNEDPVSFKRLLLEDGAYSYRMMTKYHKSTTRVVKTSAAATPIVDDDDDADCDDKAPSTGNSSGSVQVSLTIERGLHGKIIGKGGKTVRSLSSRVSGHCSVRHCAAHSSL